MDAKFESFWTALNQCPYELPEEIKPYIKDALKASGFFDAPQTVTVTSGATNTVTKTKKLSGYNVFMKEKMAELKAQNVPSGERMGKVSQMWKGLTEEQKAEWKVKADGSVTVTNTVQQVSASGVKTKKLSGYNVFMKEKMAELKAQNVPSGERMGKVSQMWKGLTEEEKGQWKVKAAAL